MNGDEIEFDWDEANIGHVARHKVLPDEAEQVIVNVPLDLGSEIKSATSTSAQRCKDGFFLW